MNQLDGCSFCSLFGVNGGFIQKLDGHFECPIVCNKDINLVRYRYVLERTASIRTSVL